jgi:hypothetical protein
MTSAMKYDLEILFIVNSSELGIEAPMTLQALRWVREFTLSASHFRQYTTPRNVQIMQMNVSQFAQG